MDNNTHRLEKMRQWDEIQRLTACIEALVDLGDRQAVPAVIDAMTHPDDLVRITAIRGALVALGGQLNHCGSLAERSGVVGPAAPVTVSNGGNALLTVCRQNTPGVASGDTHRRGCLVQSHVLSAQTVQNLKARLLFRGQSHILHSVNVTFLLAS